MPPPMTSSRFGTPPSSSAPVESMTRGSSGMNGSLMGSEPAAMMHCSKRIFSRLAVRARHFHDVRAGELAGARDHFDLALLREHRQAADQLADDLVLPLEQLGQLDFRRTEIDAMRAHLADFVDDLGGMQQRLGGNAAHVEADAAQHGPAFDQRDLEAEIRGAERGGVAAGTGTQHQQLRLAIVRHVGLERLRRFRSGRGAARVARRRGAGAGAGAAGGRRGGSGGCRGRRGSGSLSAFDARDQTTLADLAALLHQHFGDGAGRRGRHVHRGLVGFERDQRRFDFDLVARP